MTTTDHNATWTNKHRNATAADIHYALADLKETLDIWREEDNDYTRKLWSEWDYLITLKSKKFFAKHFNAE